MAQKEQVLLDKDKQVSAENLWFVVYVSVRHVVVYRSVSSKLLFTDVFVRDLLVIVFVVYMYVQCRSVS